MTYLIVILVICYITAAFSVTYPLRVAGGLGQPLPNPFGFTVPAILFTAFSGLRNNLGDTYYNMHSFSLLTDDMPKPKIADGEFLSYYLLYAIRQITDKPQLYIYIFAVIACVPAIYIIYKYSVAYELSIFLFVATSYYTFSFNGMWQYAAAGLLLLGTKYLFSEEKTAWFKYALVVLIAYMFHSTAIIMLPIFFVVRRKSWSFTTIAIIFASILGALLFDAVLPGFLGVLSSQDSYRIYSESGWFTSGNEQGSNFIRVFVVAVPIFIAYVSQDRLKHLGKKGDILVNLAVVNFSFYLVSLYNWIFARFAVYTSIYYIILLTWLIMNSFTRKDKKIVYLACILLYAGYFWFVRYSIVGYRSIFF